MRALSNVINLEEYRIQKLETNTAANTLNRQQILNQAFSELKKQTGIDHEAMLSGDKKEKQKLKMKQYQEYLLENDGEGVD